MERVFPDRGLRNSISPTYIHCEAMYVIGPLGKSVLLDVNNDNNPAYSGFEAVVSVSAIPKVGGTETLTWSTVELSLDVGVENSG